MKLAVKRAVCLVALAWPWLALPAAAQVAVHVVDDDGGPGVAFTDLQSAVSAAADGDVVLVRSGLYGSFTLRGKGLVLLEAEGADVQVRGSVAIQGVPAGRSAVLRGLDVLVPLGADPVDLSASAGSIHLEDCRIQNGNLGQFGASADALRVRSCLAVTLVRCALTGSTGGNPGGGGEALVATSSSVNVFDSQLVGGVGAIGDRNAGGHGALLIGTLLYASGTSFAGAKGGNGVTITTQFGTMCRSGGDGGSGLFLSDAMSSATLLDVQAAGGTGGNATHASCVAGTPGQPVTNQGGLVATLPWTARRFAISAPVREASTALLSFAGEPGDVVFVGLASRALAGGYLPSLAGPLLVDPSALRVLAPGVLPAGGTLLAPLFAPSVPGLTGLPFHAQALFREAGGALLLGPVSSGVVLDAAF